MAQGIAESPPGTDGTDGGGPRIAAVTCVRNEGPFLLEWIAWQRLIGVTDFLFYSNDCDDGSDRMLDALARRGGLVHLANPARGRAYQMEALADAARHPVVTGADWVWIADVDEFLNVRTGRGRLPDLIEACGNPQAISVHFQFFANGGVRDFEDRPVVAQFDLTHNPDICDANPEIEVKTLVRRDFPLHYFGAHRPFARKGAAPAWTDASGRPVPQDFAEGREKARLRRFPARGARRFATLNHYALRALDSYLVKADRGDVNRANRAFDETYWRARNDAAWTDRSILRHLPALEREIATLRADREIATLHDQAVDWHRARRDALLRDPAYRALRDRLCAAPTLPPTEEAALIRLGLDG